MRVVRVSVEQPPDLWRLEPDSRIGVLVGHDWDLRIEPRLGIPKLFFLLAYSQNPKGWRDLTIGFEEAEDVVSALASGFSTHAERALHRGLLHGYVHIEEHRQDLRGRIRFAAQLARGAGLPLPLEVAYDDFLVDIPENRFLRTAAEILLRLPRIPPLARTRLMRIRALLEDVNLIEQRRNATAPPITRLNERYASALALAELVLRAGSVSPEEGPKSSASFLFDMNEVFESFVTTALTDALRPYGGWARPQFSSALDIRGALPVRPDITWWRGNACRAIVDVKYKSLVDRTSMPNADAYQMLAYCIALGVPQGHLIYAKESGEQSGEHVVRRHGYVISVRSLDVGLAPPALLGQVDMLAAEIAGQSLGREAA